MTPTDLPLFLSPSPPSMINASRFKCVIELDVVPLRIFLRRKKNKTLPILHNINMRTCPRLVINTCNFLTTNWEKLNFYHSSWSGIQHNIVHVFKHDPSWIVTFMLVWIILNLQLLEHRLCAFIGNYRMTITKV